MELIRRDSYRQKKLEARTFMDDRNTRHGYSLVTGPQGYRHFHLFRHTGQKGVREIIKGAATRWALKVRRSGESAKTAVLRENRDGECRGSTADKDWSVAPRLEKKSLPLAS